MLLFLCTGNSCRSQMAEGWTRHLKGDNIEVYSAGILAKGVDRRAIAVMEEEGVDISDQRSTNVQELLDIEFDYVITLCGHARETCPIFPRRTMMIHRGFEDPPVLAADSSDEEESLGHYRRIRDEIRKFVEELPGILGKMQKATAR